MVTASALPALFACDPSNKPKRDTLDGMPVPVRLSTFRYLSQEGEQHPRSLDLGGHLQGTTAFITRAVCESHKQVPSVQRGLKCYGMHAAGELTLLPWLTVAPVVFLLLWPGLSLRLPLRSSSAAVRRSDDL